MKIKNLIAVAALLLGSASTFAQGTGIYSGDFKIQETATAGKYEIVDFSNDFVIPASGVVTIPATLPNSSGDPYQIIGVANNAFAKFGDPGREIRLDITGVSFAKEIKYIGANAFADFGNLATVTFAENSALTWIGDGAFAQDPMLRSISFANCSKLVYFTDNGKATDDASDPGNYTTPFVNTTVPTNTRLTSITLNTKTIDFGLALQKIENLETVNIKDTKIRVLNGNALQGNKKITTLELPAKPVYSEEDGSLVRTESVKLLANALNGTAIATLTINGNVAANGIAALGIPMTTATTPAPALTTVTITGDVATGGILAKAFAGNTKLATVTIQGVVAAGAVLGGAFGPTTSTGTDFAGSAATAKDGIKLTVTASQAVATAFAQDAFVFAGGADVTHDVSLALSSTAGSPTIYRANIVPAPTTPGKIFVECKEGDAYYYAKVHATSKISVKRGAGDVVVYSAYADGTTIYMDPLYSVDDKYTFGTAGTIEEAKNVIIKVKGTSKLLKTDEKTGKKYIESEETPAAPVTMRYKYSQTKPFNGIGYDAHITNQALNAKASAATKVIWAVAKISSNGLKWQPISNEGTFYLNDAMWIEVDKPAAGGRVNVVWLDEEDATAIKKIEAKKADSDAIYNLRGEKVNAAYKGIVIKNGKKYIQK